MYEKRLSMSVGVTSDRVGTHHHALKAGSWPYLKNIPEIQLKTSRLVVPNYRAIFRHTDFPTDPVLKIDVIDRVACLYFGETWAISQFGGL